MKYIQETKSVPGFLSLDQALFASWSHDGSLRVQRWNMNWSATVERLPPTHIYNLQKYKVF